MKSPTRTRLPSIDCPHCGARALVRTSEAVTDLVRDVRLRCTNDDCGHIFVAQLSIVRTIVPSIRPNPAVLLPIANPNLVALRPKPANDDTRTPANDTDPLLPAAADLDPMSG